MFIAKFALILDVKPFNFLLEKKLEMFNSFKTAE